MNWLLVLLSGYVFGAGATLESVNTYKDGSAVVAEIKLTSPLGEEAVALDYINETVQIDIPSTTFDGKKKFQQPTISELRNIYIYQLKEGGTRIRLIFPKGVKTKSFEQSTVAINSGKVLRVKIYPPDTVGANDFSQLSSTLTASAATATESVSKKIDAADIEKASKKLVGDVKAKQKIPESKMPVLKSKAKVATSAKSVWSRMAVSLAIVLALIVGVALFSKKWWKGKVISKQNQNIKVMTQHHLGPKKSLAIIRVAGESILIGVTDHNISMIKSLALLDEEIPENVGTNFSSTLQEADTLANEDTGEDEPREEFAMKGLKDLVTDRLKGMKEI